MIKKIITGTVLLFSAVSLSNCAYFTAKNEFERVQAFERPPDARKAPAQTEYHGQPYIDDYAWLRDKENPEVIAYLNAENNYTQKLMKHTEGLQQNLYNEMLARIKETDISAPVKIDNYYYYSKTEAGKQYQTYARKQGSLDAPEEIILDLNEMAAGKDYLALGVFEISPDHRYLAYSIDDNGSEKYTMYFKNLENNTLLADQVPETYYSAAWANDNKTFFYVIQDAASRPFKVLRHVLGTDPATDSVVHHETDESYYASVSKTRSDRFILLNLGSQITSEVRYLEADNPAGVFRVFKAREKGVEYALEHRENFFYIHTNEEARNFKVMRTPVNATERINWQLVIPHSIFLKIEEVDAFKNYLVAVEREEGLKKILVIDLINNNPKYVEFPEQVYSVSGGNNPEYETDTFRFHYESLTTPDSVYDYNMAFDERFLVKRQEVLGGYDPEQYQSERLLAEADDGSMIPVSLVYKKGIQKDGTNPLYLYGYGSYGSTTDPYFTSSRLSLLDRGVIFAIAHIRGSGDLDREWYEQGKFLNKKNTFTDFIDSAEYLIQQGYTSNNKLVISGGSAGGLLMGAVTNMRPDLFHIVIADVPFVDVINTMMDPTLPLTVIEYDEWGDPNNKEYFDYMMSYSPYDNVKAQAYPHMLVTAGLNDPRVGYWEPAKLVARLRDMKTDNNVLMLKTNMGAGHGGSSGRYDYLKELAFEYAFITSLLGIGK